MDDVLDVGCFCADASYDSNCPLGGYPITLGWNGIVYFDLHDMCVRFVELSGDDSMRILW